MNESTQSLPDPIEIIAHALLALLDTNDDDAPDLLAAFTALEPLMRPDEYYTLARMLDLCPIHHCDIEICADDDRTCPKLIFGK